MEWPNEAPFDHKAGAGLGASVGADINLETKEAQDDDITARPSETEDNQMAVAVANTGNGMWMERAQDIEDEEEIMEIADSGRLRLHVELPSGGDGEDVYVAVGKSASSMDALSWALKNVVKPGSFVYLIHVFPEVQLIPIPLQITDLTASIDSIPMLKGSNFKEWKDNLEIILGCLDLDTVLQEAKPSVPVETSSDKEQNAHARWMSSNRLYLRVMQKTIPESFRGPVSDSTLAKDYLKELEQRFVRNEKAEIGILLNKLCTMKYHGKGNVREHILEMMNAASKLKGHKLDISDDMLVYLALNSLPASFGQFKVSYNCQKDSWTVNELISHCVQEEERMKSKKSESANIASTSKGKGKQKRKANSDAATTSSQKKPNKEKKSVNGSEPNKEKKKGCFFCGSDGHVKKNCTNYHAWRAKKGLPKLPEVK